MKGLRKLCRKPWETPRRRGGRGRGSRIRRMHTHSMYVQILFRAMGMAHHTSVSHSSVLMNLISVTKNGVCECCSFALHRQSLCESGVAHVCKRVARIRWQVFVVNVRGHVLTKSICLLCSVGVQDNIGGVHEGKLAHQEWWVPSRHSPLRCCCHTYMWM